MPSASASVSQTADDAPERVLRAQHGLAAINFGELWRFRELFFFLSWRDILVRYKQTALGISWALLQPFLTMVVFTVIFGRFAGFPSKGAQYAVMTLAALLPWGFFSNALGESGNSLVVSANMISKIYFPRLIVPASAVLSGTVDFLVGLALLFAVMLWYHVAFQWRLLLLLPLFMAEAFLAALAAGAWLSALYVKYRDVKYITPFLVRIGIYVCPVGYMSSMILDKCGRQTYFFYCLNPMVGVIDGFRWCILGSAFEPYWPGFFASLGLTFLFLLLGLVYFRTTERRFADVI
jgi:lipopolysaccharide transport system permease protein